MQYPFNDQWNLDQLRTRARVASLVLSCVLEALQAGKTGKELSCYAAVVMKELGAVPLIKNYMGFPEYISISINEVVCNGIPSSTRRFQEGDLITVDIVVKIYDTIFDIAKTLVLGIHPQDPMIIKLIQTSNEVIQCGLSHLKWGVTPRHLFAVMEAKATSNGFYLANLPFGHGVGRSIHEPPFLYSTSEIPIDGPYDDLLLSFEPIISTSFVKPQLGDDGWSWQLPLGELSCFDERMVVVRRDRELILIC
jgi:methionyl aminopeptidase